MKVKKLLNNERIIPLTLVLTSLIINLYYFNANTGIWWDEAEYLSYVNHVVKGSPHALWEGRAILYPLILSVFGFISTSERFLRIALVLSSIITVFFTYLTFKEFFNKKIGLITSVLLLTNPIFNFFSIRFLTDIPSLMFLLIGLYFFQRKDYKNGLLSGLFLGFSIMTRFTSLIIIPVLVIYDLMEGKEDVKKWFWIPSMFLSLMPVVVFDFIQTNSPFNSVVNFIQFNALGRSTSESLSNWSYYITHLPSILGFNIYFTFFLVLCLITGVYTLYSVNKKSKLLLLGGFLLVYFLSFTFLTPVKYNRFMLPILPFFYSISTLGLINIIKYLSKKIKSVDKKLSQRIILSIIILIFLLNSLQLTNIMIMNSKNSFEELRTAGEDLKKETSSEEIIITNAGPHVTYYSERENTCFPSNISALYTELKKDNLNYILISLYEATPDYLNKIYNSDDLTLYEEYPQYGKKAVLVFKYKK